MIFKYRAYDSKLEIKEGTIESASFTALALTLRQSGLQVIDATTVSNNIAEKRLEKMKERFVFKTEEKPKPFLLKLFYFIFKS